MLRKTLFPGLILFVLLSVGWAQQKPVEFTDLFSMGRVADPQISSDGKWIAYTVTGYTVADNSKNVDIYLVSADGKEQKRLTDHPKTDTNPRWSPADSKTLAFISNRDGSAQVYLVDLTGGLVRKVTNSATEVKEFAWSPDGKYIALATDMHPAAKTTAESAEIDAQKAQSLVTGKIIDGLLYRHWDEWREGKYSRIVTVPVDGGEEVNISPAGADCPPISLGSKHDFVWSPDGRQICFVQNRDKIVAASTNNDLWLTGSSGGEVTQISMGKGNDIGPRFSADGKYIAYMSMSRAGYESDKVNLIVYNITGGKFRNLTENLDRSVEDFGWSPDSKKLYFYVPHHARHRVYEVGLEDAGPRLLLDKNCIGALRISPGGKYLLLQIQRVNLPYELFRFDLNSRMLTQLTFTNRERLAQLEMPPLEEYWFTGANNDSVHLLLLKPPQFDPAKKYPLVSLIHGGPHGAFEDEFHYRWNAEMFASPGYVVIMINFHASAGYGQAFSDAVSKNWGGWPYEDIMTGTKWAIQQFNFIDGDRVGAAGASYGGFMVNWIAGHNPQGLFKVLVSHDGVYEQVSMFGATEELWFPIWEFNGIPWEAETYYQQWNPVHYANNFNTPTLVVHGEKDYRVPYTQGLQMFTALQLKGVDSRLLFFPDENHFVLKPQNARLWWNTVHEWLGKYLKP
jgi:dipeptidyl aminopeptidase/acylaminoacyl peptidase